MDLLPIALWLDIVLEYSTLEEEQHFVQTCRWTRFTLSPHLTENRRFLLVNDAKTVRLLLRHPILVEQMANLHYLDLSCHATDELLLSMHTCMPMLQTLSLVASSGVTNAGVETLGSDPNRCRQLQVLDITLCTRISYRTTLVLRRALFHPKLVIRRIPKWMEGHFETPFENDGMHTYWADGSFSFDRTHCDCGYIRSLWDWGSDYNEPGAKVRWYGNGLLFVNGHPDLTIPLQEYTPGVTLVPVSEPHCMNEPPTSIVVAQSLRQMEPPCPSSELYCSISRLPMGKSKYFQWESTLEPRPRYIETERSNATVMVTRMARTCLEQLMPPAHIVQQIQNCLGV
jgi:hypothetical protein